MSDERRGGPSDLEAALDRWGSTPIAVDADRLDALETRVLDRIGSDDGRRGGVLPLTRRRRRSARTVAGGAVAASIIVILALALGWLATGDDAVVIAAADGVEVTLPDGDVVDGTAGLEIPEGSQLEVTGFVVVDGERFGPGSYVLVDDELAPVLDDGEARNEPSISATTRPPGELGGASVDDGPEVVEDRDPSDGSPSRNRNDGTADIDVTTDRDVEPTDRPSDDQPAPHDSPILDPTDRDSGDRARTVERPETATTAPAQTPVSTRPATTVSRPSDEPARPAVESTAPARDPDIQRPPPSMSPETTTTTAQVTTTTTTTTVVQRDRRERP